MIRQLYPITDDVTDRQPAATIGLLYFHASSLLRLTTRRKIALVELRQIPSADCFIAWKHTNDVIVCSELVVVNQQSSQPTIRRDVHAFSSSHIAVRRNYVVCVSSVLIARDPDWLTPASKV